MNKTEEKVAIEAQNETKEITPKFRGRKSTFKKVNNEEFADYINYLKTEKIHKYNLFTIFHNNAEIRRFVSKSIINYLMQTGVINPEDKAYVTFNTNGFKLYIGKKITSYDYTEPFFANCYCASFVSFGNHGQKVLNDYLHKECGIGIEKQISEEEIGKIVTINKEEESE